MSAVGSPTRRLRLLLDCYLVLLLILAISAQDQRVLGQAGRQPMTAGRQADDSSLFSSPAAVDMGQAVEPLPPDQVTLDNKTLAAMIAAENAALTPPQNLLDLPVVTR